MNDARKTFLFCWFAVVLGVGLVAEPSRAADATTRSARRFIARRYEIYTPREDTITDALDRAETVAPVRPARVPYVEPLDAAIVTMREHTLETAGTPQAVTVGRISDQEGVPIGQDVPIREKGKTMADQFLDFDDPRNSFEMGTEAFDYSYREEGFMKVDGMMYGVTGEYTHRFRPAYQTRSVADLSETIMHPTMIRLDARASGMWDGNYRSEGSGEAVKEQHYAVETRAVAGYDYDFVCGTTVTPYMGLGYRYLLDDNGGRYTSTGNWGYDRESTYYYVPMGVEVVKPLSSKWSAQCRAEYDWFLSGQQRSHNEDDPNGNYTQTLVNRQTDGYGARGSLKLFREGESLDFFLEPFVRYWHIEDSKLNCTDETCGIEPNNRTHEYGLRMGVGF